MTSACDDRRRVFLLITNILLVVLGITALVMTCLVHSELEVIQTDILPLLKDINIDSFNLGDVIIGLSYAMLFIGLLCLVTGSLGIVGVWWRDKRMLLVYNVVIAALFVSKLVAVSMWINTKIKLENDGRTQLTASLFSNFKDDTLTNANSISNAWNFLFMSLDCCGIDTIIGQDNVFNVTSWCITSGDCHDGVKYIPLSCCTGVTVTEYYATYTCYLALDDGSYNYKGCFSALKTAVSAYGDGFIALGIILLVLEVLAFIFTLMDVCGNSSDRM